MEVKNSDDRVELIQSSKSKNNKKSDNKISNRNDRETTKTDVINLDKPMNSNNSNLINSKSEKININTNNNDHNNNFDAGLNKINETGNKQNGVDSKSNNEIQKNVNLKGKQEDISIFDITNGGRVITDLEIKNAPVLLLEVNI